MLWAIDQPGIVKPARDSWQKVEKATTTAALITQNGGQAIAVVGDILDDAYQAELIRCAAEFGNGKIHVLVNNAGFTWDGVIHKVSPIQEMSILPIYTPCVYIWSTGWERLTSHFRWRINNGKPCWPSTTPHRLNWCEQLHRTSAWRMARIALW